MVELGQNPVLDFSGVDLVRNDQPVLHDINLTSSEHRIGVIGANGSGKSSFARLLNGLLQPTNGVAKILGHDVSLAQKQVRRRVGFVFQNPDNQIVYPVVSEDIELGLKGLKIPKDQRKVKVDEILSRFNLLHLRDRSVHMLSGGEKQMIALSSVLIMQPKMIVFDEPTTLLDLRNRNAVASTIMGLEQYVVLVTHDLELLADFDRVLVFEEGRVAVDDTPKAAISWYKKKMAL